MVGGVCLGDPPTMWANNYCVRGNEGVFKKENIE